MPGQKLTVGAACAAFVMLLAWPLQNARADAGLVRFCFNDWPPYTTVRNGEAAGISVEILREAATRAGLDAVFTELPWNRCLKMVSDGELDAVIDAAVRDNFLQGPTSVARYSNTFWVRDRDEARSFAPDALKGRKLGLVDGYIYPPSLLSLIGEAEMEIEYAVDDATNVRKLVFGRVDVVVADIVAMTVFARDRGLSIRPLQPSHSVDLLYPSFNPERGNLHRAIDASLAAMLDSGAIDRIYTEHASITFADVVAKSDVVRP